MTDPRWQRAMTRLGLKTETPCPCSIVGLYFGHKHEHFDWPDPDDPATFLRVVEAVLAKGKSIHLYPNRNAHLFERIDHGTFTKDSFVSEGTTLYEAVMEAFGKE